MHVLLTGSAGLLGRAVHKLFAERGDHVAGVVRPSLGTPSTDRLSIPVDLSSPIWTSTAFPSRIDLVVHLAQSRRFREFPSGTTDVFGVNVHATARLLDYAVRAGATRFLYASSGGVYRHGEAALKEHATLKSVGELGFYLGSKVAAEILVQSYAALLNVVILRPFFVYGPGQRRDMLIPRIFDRVRDAQPVGLDGEDGLSINPIHVMDAALAVCRATELPEGAVINIAGPEKVTLREIAIAFGQHLGRAPIFERTGSSSRSILGSIDLMSEILYAPQRRLRHCVNDVDDRL